MQLDKEEVHLKAGDVVIQINRVPVPDVAAFTGLWSRASGRTELTLHRTGRTVRLIVNK